jgi:Uma2 family endonuclease
MTGGTTNHNKIALNCAANLKFGLRGKHYQTFIGDVSLWIPSHKIYTYPDVMVIEGEAIYQGSGATTVTNPLLIIEVLSKFTRNYDLGENFIYYRSIPQLQEYIAIEQKNFYLIQYAKTLEGKWLLTEYESKKTVINLTSVQFQINFEDIYEGINLESGEE